MRKNEGNYTMADTFEWSEDVETRRVTVEVPTDITAEEINRALEVVSSQRDSVDDDSELRERHDRGYRA